MLKRIKKIWKLMGPGFITGASDDDPSGIATYSQTGALFGFKQLWGALFSFPLMTAIQEMCGRIGMVTGDGLTTALQKHYSKKIVILAVSLLAIANIVNIGADISAMAAATQLMIDIPFYVLVIAFMMITLLLEIFLSYKVYANYLKYLSLSLLAYVFTALIVQVDWRAVMIATFIPHFEFTKEYFLNLVAFFGTTISPYLFFWQANQEIEELNNHVKEAQKQMQQECQVRTLADLRLDTTFGMLFSNIIAWFIIITTGATLYPNGIRSIETAADAAIALKPLAGEWAFLIFALGIIGTGMLAIPVLAGSVAYAVAELFDIKAGLDYTLKEAPGFYGILSAVMILGLLVNVLPIAPMQFLYYTAVVNGICACPLIFIIIHLANNKSFMGDCYNGKLSNILSIITFIIMSLSTILLLVSYFI